MKKLFTGGLILATAFAGLTGCEKESRKTVNPTSPANEPHVKLAGYTYAETQRSYTWVENNTKLDCSASGSGCTVSAKYVSDASEIELSVLQVTKLMDIGSINVGQYFLSHDLSYEFPSFYNNQFYSDLTAGKVTLNFEFPYLKIFNTSNGNLVKAYNYESTLSNSSVTQKIQSAGGFTKKIAVNTGTTGGPWKCTESGDNCKVSSVKFNVDWLADNPQYTYVPNLGTPSSVVKDNTNRKIKIVTASGSQYGIEL